MNDTWRITVITTAAALLVGLSTATQLAWELRAHQVPAVPLLLSAAAVGVTAYKVVAGVVRVVRRTVFRCSAPDCVFQVTVTGHLDAGATRRWQEIAADHPHHRTAW